MAKRMFALFCVVSLFIALSAAASADSMLTSPPSQQDGGLLIVGNENDGNISQESATDDVLCVSLKKKVEKIWGPEVARKKMETDADESENYNGQYPPIVIRVRTNSAAGYKTSYKYRHLYSSRHKSYNANTSAQYMNITPIIVDEAKKNGISPLLLKAVIQTESGFNHTATSCAGAMGLCQLMPGTARILGVNDPYDPVQSIRGGARYLGTLKRMFKSTDLVLAAYNAGPGTVQRSGGVPNIWETRRYITKVRSNMKW